MDKLYGWTGKLLHVDLTVRTFTEWSTRDYALRFIGGKGLGAKIYWDKLAPQRDAFYPDSPLIIMTGPLAATPAPSASRWIVCGKSPSLYPENFACANLGGFVGAAIKQAGYDGIIIHGKASSRVYLCIDNNKVTIKDAGHLWGLTTPKTMSALQNELGGGFRIVTTGPAGEHQVRLATVATDAGGSGAAGFGAVMGAKNVKAIAVRGSSKVPVADADAIQVMRRQIQSMTGEGYFNLYGNPAPVPEAVVVKAVRCHGCPSGCWRSLYRTTSGEEGIRKCQSAFFYSFWDKKVHGDLTEASFRATSLANEYSLCTMELPGILTWLENCVENGAMTEKDTELPLQDAGSAAFIEALVKKISCREGIGAILAEGVMRAADTIGAGAKKLALDHFTQTGRGIAYGPKIFSPSALIFATEPRPSVAELHEICGPLIKWALWYTTQGSFSYVSTDVLIKIAARFWGSADAADFSTYAGKARAAVKIQNRQHAKDSLILCDFAFPLYDDARTEDHVGDPTLESRLFSAVTGHEMDEAALNQAGERIFNLCRAILLREGRNGREDDYLPESQFIAREEPVHDAFGMFNPDLYLPGTGDSVISVKGKALNRDGFEQMKNEYYELRGWDVKTGFFKEKKLHELDLAELVEQLEGKVLGK
jgi:aldehyde:ferredoxin oxidoreductase